MIPVKFKRRLYLERKSFWQNVLDETIPSTDIGRGQTTSSMIPNLGTNKLEERLKTTYNRKHCVFTNCATDALDFVLSALPFDTWYVPSYTWYSPINAIYKTGAKIKFLEVNFDTRTVNYEGYNPKFPVLVPHIDGLTAKPPPERGPFVLEDAAQSPLSPGNNFGDAIVLSFGSSKKLGFLGQGGCVLMDDEDLAKKLKSITTFGLDESRDLAMAGFKSFLDPYNAHCTYHLFDWYKDKAITDKLSRIISYYNDCTGYEHPEYLERYTVKLNNRDRFREKANDDGIETRVWFKEHAARYPIYQAFRTRPLEVSDHLSQICTDVPMNEMLEDDEIEKVGQFLMKYKGSYL